MLKEFFNLLFREIRNTRSTNVNNSTHPNIKGLPISVGRTLHVVFIKNERILDDPYWFQN
jgi:hypothetical protein